jgi:hypothetical protein
MGLVLGYVVGAIDPFRVERVLSLSGRFESIADAYRRD